MAPGSQLVSRITKTARQCYQRLKDRIFARFPALQRRQTLAGCAILIGLILGFLLGARYFGSEMIEKRAIETALELAQQRVHQLELEKAGLNTGLQVDQETTKRLTSMLSRLENDLAEARDELRLYKSLMGDYSDQQLPSARAVRMRLVEPNKYAYLLVLEQGKSKKGKSIKVNIDMSLLAFKGEEWLNLSMRELDEAFPARDEALAIRYFKMIEGEFTLPQDLTPVEVVVDIRTADSDAEVISRRFPWKTSR